MPKMIKRILSSFLIGFVCFAGCSLLLGAMIFFPTATAVVAGIFLCFYVGELVKATRKGKMQ